MERWAAGLSLILLICSRRMAKALKVVLEETDSGELSESILGGR